MGDACAALRKCAQPPERRAGQPLSSGNGDAGGEYSAAWVGVGGAEALLASLGVSWGVERRKVGGYPAVLGARGL